MEEQMNPYDDYCLVAIQGDCSAYGMGDTADFIPLKDRSFFTLIKSYLRNQLELDLKHVEMEVADLLKDQEFNKLVQEHHDLGNALIHCGIFLHKWHKRTTWALMEMDEGKPINVTFKVKEAA